MKTLLSTAACAALLLTGCDAVAPGGASATGDAPVAYAHESNNRAELSGDGVTGTAIVNYAKGSPTEWASSVNVRGGLDAGTYDFYVTLNGTGETLVCSFTAGRGGRQGCSADTALPGFNTAEVRDSDGDVVASGTFERRGGNRAVEPTQGGRPLSASLTGEAEVPGPGDPDGTGTADVTLNRGQGEVCFELAVEGIEPATAAHIHFGDAGEAGPVVIALEAPTDGTSSGCASGVDRDVIDAIADGPSGYYVNVHNAEYPAGALRGQLGS